MASLFSLNMQALVAKSAILLQQPSRQVSILVQFQKCANQAPRCALQYSHVNIRTRSSSTTTTTTTNDKSNVVPLVWTTHLLTSEQIQRVEKVFHKILWLDMVEVHMLNEHVRERMNITITEKQRQAMIKQVQALNLYGKAEENTTTTDVKVEEAPAAPKVFELKLTGFDPKSKIKVIKEVRAIAGLGLKEAKELVESNLPKSIMKDLKQEQADQLKAKLIEAGAQVELS